MSRKGRGRRQERMCVYCGETRLCTDEHVIPRGFFREDISRPDNSVIIPACKPCNDRKARDDSYVRDLFAADIACEASPVAKQVLHGQVFRSIRKHWSEFAKVAAHRGQLTPVHTPNGLYLGHAFGVPIEWKKVNRFFRCVVRGLYWHRFNARIPDDYLFDVRRLKDSFVAEAFAEMDRLGANGPYGIGEGVFGCRFLIGEEDPFVTHWQFWFYERIFVSVATGPKAFFEPFVSKGADPIAFGAEF